MVLAILYQSANASVLLVMLGVHSVTKRATRILIVSVILIFSRM